MPLSVTEPVLSRCGARIQSAKGLADSVLRATSRMHVIHFIQLHDAPNGISFERVRILDVRVPPDRLQVLRYDMHREQPRRTDSNRRSTMAPKRARRRVKRAVRKRARRGRVKKAVRRRRVRRVARKAVRRRRRAVRKVARRGRRARRRVKRAVRRVRRRVRRAVLKKAMEGPEGMGM